MTFGLIPDCLCSRFGGTLVEVEQAVLSREQGTAWGAAIEARPDHEDNPVALETAVRWVRRRVVAVHAVLAALIVLDLSLFGSCQPTIESFRSQLGVKWVLVELREMVPDRLTNLPPPLGFGPGSRPARPTKMRLQQRMGPDPPVDRQ